ncbi:hypothetical protein Acr_00g0031000 [Actinidia rufa]|uniref:Uncharacterized protein n=1 Tax=Actinidia rufa TaxID=165716 RepID=A0A7J0DF81_9ERIC|nr:hypothetical protein Acr_00g0031000 [Actinidia rufa]
MPPSVGIPRIPRVWRSPNKHCNKLPAVFEIEAKKTADVLKNIELGGYFDVFKVFKSKTLRRYFDSVCDEVSFSGGNSVKETSKDTTSGDEGESRPIRDKHIGHNSPSQDDSIECLGVTRRDIGKIARRAFLDTLDLTLLSLATLTKKTGKKRVTTKDVISTATAKPPLKGIVIQEMRSRDDAHDSTPNKKGEVDGSKGKDALLPPPPKKAKSNKGQAMWFGDRRRRRRLVHHHPNLSIDLAGIEMDIDLAKKEEAVVVSEKEEENEGDIGPTP